MGAAEAMGSRTLVKLMKKFSEKYPTVQFELYNEMADNVKNWVDKGLVDIGFVLEPVDTTKYDFMRISQKETWGILVPANHPLADQKTAAVQQASQYPPILPKRENVHHEILNWLGKEDLSR